MPSYCYCCENMAQSWCMKCHKPGLNLASERESGFEMLDIPDQGHQPLQHIMCSPDCCSGDLRCNVHCFWYYATSPYGRGTSLVPDGIYSIMQSCSGSCMSEVDLGNVWYGMVSLGTWNVVCCVVLVLSEPLCSGRVLSAVFCWVFSAWMKNRAHINEKIYTEVKRKTHMNKQNYRENPTKPQMYQSSSLASHIRW